MVFPNPFPSSKARIVTVALLTAFFIAGGIYLFHTRNSTSPNLSNNNNSTKSFNAASDSSQGTQGSGASQISMLTLPKRSGLSSYVSQANKVGFYFSPNQGGINFAVKESGNKVTVYEKENPNVEQTLEIFNKNSTDTIQEAITKAVLGGYTASNCPISISSQNAGYPNNIETASINYSSDNHITNGFGIADRSKCPILYTVAFDNKYFLVDKNHPTKLLFFNLGQFLIPAGQSQSWQDTITQF